MTADQVKRWDALTRNETKIDFRLVGEGRRAAGAKPTNRLLHIEFNTDEPRVYWHRSGETHYRCVEAKLLVLVQEELAHFPAGAITIISGTAMVFDSAQTFVQQMVTKVAMAEASQHRGKH